METIVKTHIGAYAIIIKENNIALIKKARGGYKGKYDLPGGGIEHTETPVEALHRECLEEIEGTVIKEELVDVTAVNIKWLMEENLTEDLHHIGILYKVRIKEENLKIDPDGLDSDGAVWLNIATLTKEMVSPFTWYALQKLNYKL